MQKKAKGGINKDRFALWLKSQLEFGGVDSYDNLDAHENPLAVYLSETRGHTDVTVGKSFVEYTRPNGRFVNQALPDWAVAFRKNFDDENISAREAIDFLATVS